MTKQNVFLIVFSLILGGCATSPGIVDNKDETELVDIPVNYHQDQAKDEGSQEAFEDVSLSLKGRTQALTNRSEITKETDNYVENGQANVITRPDGTVLFPYGLSEVTLTTKKMMYSKVVLEEGERIVSVAAGDTVRWHFLPSYIGDSNDYTPVVLIKPFFGGQQTSLSIITDKRDYDILIRSVDTGDYISRIGFYYPQDKADSIKVQAPPDSTDTSENNRPKINVDNINRAYIVKGDKRLLWYPLSVFDDGQKVFIKMRKNVNRSELPVFMTVNAVGQTEVVNYRYFRPYFVIDTLFNKGILEIGTDRYQQSITIIKK